MVALEAGHKYRRPEALFDKASNAFTNAACLAAEDAKKEHADKRRKSLGLPED